MPNPNTDSHAATRLLQTHDEDPNATADPMVPLRNLSRVRTRMDSLQRFLSQSLDTNTLLADHQITRVSNDIASAIHQIMVNGAALVSCSQNLTAAAPSAFPAARNSPDPPDAAPLDKPGLDFPIAAETVDLKSEVPKDDNAEDCEIVELNAMELLAGHIHSCEICGKGFRRDANLRMHMRAHGNQFKAPEALARPSSEEDVTATPRRAKRFSCPFGGCNRNRQHEKFKPLKSIICGKNHFKRSHCPKMYSCNRCHKRNFSMLPDLRSHMKHCGESRWKCACGTTFSRKEKLFGHMAVFKCRIAVDEDEKGNQVVALEEEVEDPILMTETGFGICFLDDGLPEVFFDYLD